MSILVIREHLSELHLFLKTLLSASLNSLFSQYIEMSYKSPIHLQWVILNFHFRLSLLCSHLKSIPVRLLKSSILLFLLAFDWLVMGTCRLWQNDFCLMKLSCSSRLLALDWNCVMVLYLSSPGWFGFCSVPISDDELICWGIL